MEPSSKHTPLFTWHQSAGANLADFGGYRMPLWYASAKLEHLSVLTHAGLFDTSHMAAIVIEGTGARALLQHCFTKNMDACVGKTQAPLKAGRCVYGAFLNEAGGVIDDAIVYCFSKSAFMVVVNAGMGATLATHLEENRKDRDATVTDLTDRLGKIDLQGPLSAKILHRLLAAPHTVLGDLPYFAFKGGFDDRLTVAGAVQVHDIPVLLSRSGYTGEFGFELYVAAMQTETLWDAVMDAGAELGLTACGLASRDSLRAGAVLPLSHQDIGSWPFIRHPWHFALPFNTAGDRFTKHFIGDAALLSTEQAQYTAPFVGQDLRKVSIQDPASVLDENGQPIGEVLTCVTDMGIDRVDDAIVSIASPGKPDAFKPKGLCCGFVKVNRRIERGTRVQLQDKRRTLPATIVSDIRPDRTARAGMARMLQP